MTRSYLPLAAASLLLPLTASFADVTLPAIFSDHMVLEKTAKVPIWGKADPGEKVTITLGEQTVSATAGQDGKWKAVLNLKDSAAGPFEVTVQGKNSIKISDVVVGEVWVASGQSNMEWPMSLTTKAEEEIAKSANPLLRQFAVTKAAGPQPAEDMQGNWVLATPETTHAFGAVGYYFGKKLQNTLKVPVGIIHTNWGGTPSEAWTSAEAIKSNPELKASSEALWNVFDTYPDKVKQYLADFPAWLEKTKRADQKTADPAAFAGVDISTQGWTPVTLPGVVSPKNGAVWLRQDVTIAEKPTAPLTVTFGDINGFESFYWNGKLLKEVTYEALPAGVRTFTIPAEDVVVGKNVAALRIYAPTTPAEVKAVPAGLPFANAAEWLSKVEYELPALADQSAVPVQPAGLPTGGQNVSSYLYNGMIAPVIPYAIKGAIWYQGESNAGRAYQYRTAFPLMITDWRKQWDQGDFPFYFCQLASFQAKPTQPGDSAWAELREAQSLTLKTPNTGQAILIDIGESADIHPRNKKDVGERLALIALAKDYGQKIDYSGPVYKSMKVKDGKAILSFDQLGGGLVAHPVPATYDVISGQNQTAPLVRNSPNSELEGFAICGEDKQWVWADAKIEGDTVVVSAKGVTKPIAVRYAWADNPNVNLYNKAGLPASPFRTDDFTPVTLNGKY